MNGGREVGGVDVVGIATDHCVKATALDGVRAHCDVHVPLLDHPAGVALSGEPVVHA